MLAPEDVKVLDLNAAWHGVPTHRLMSNAGRAVADAVLRAQPRRVVVLAGLGNNGGDGAVAARLLSKDGVECILAYADDTSKIKSEAAIAAYEAAKAANVPITIGPAAVQIELQNVDVIVDALLGVGTTGRLRGNVALMVKAARRAKKPVVAVDLPTGLGSPDVLAADSTITFHDRKHGMTREACGRVTVADIGIPEAAQGCGPGDLALAFRPNEPASHKGMNGRVLVVGGGPYTGAAALSGLAALRVGVDLVHLYTPGRAAAVARNNLDLIVHDGVREDRLDVDDVPRLDRLLPKFDVMLIGPGLGTQRSTMEAARALLAATRKRKMGVVVDADAHAVAGERALLGGRPSICTPHAREFESLTGRAFKPARAGQRVADTMAKSLGTVLLVKGATDWVTDGRRSKPNQIHHEWMTAGGTGDVLAGVTAGLLSRNDDAWRVACAAAFLNGAAGKAAFSRIGWGARATDLVESLPTVLRDWLPAVGGDFRTY